MVRRVVGGVGIAFVAAVVMQAQAVPPQGDTPTGRGGGRGAGAQAAGGVGRGAGEATAAQWANPSPEAKKWIDEAYRIA